MSAEKKEGFFSQIKNQIIAGVGIVLTTLGGVFIDEVKSFVGIEDDSEPQTEVVQENNQSVNVEGPTIVVNIPEQNGLEKTIPDEKERYRTIVEECLYFSDINSTNYFICKLLTDPYNEYKLNYNEGNTLELNIKEKWDIEGFDAVIGNPPYEVQNASGDNKLYLAFISYSIKYIYDNALLLFIALLI
jgi:hypothetical protein